MNNKHPLTTLGVVAFVAFAIGMKLAMPAQAQQSKPGLRYEVVYGGSRAQGGIEIDAPVMTRLLNERTAAGWRFVAADRSLLIFVKE